MYESSRISDIERRISAIENRLGNSRPSIPRSQPETTKDAISFSPFSLSSKESPSAVPVAGVPAEKKNVESYIGRWLLGVVGVIAIILGARFFLKYAFESNLIGPAGRVILGIAGGLLFVVLGEVFRSRLAKYSYLLSGGGVALFFFSIFGGFLTPYLASSGVANDFGFFGYLIILNVGILAVAFFKKWHELTLLGFTATVINFASWYGAYYEPEKLWIALFVLTVFYFIFLFSGFAANVITRKMSSRADLFVLTINAAWFFGWCYFLLRPEYYGWLGFIAALLGGVYILLGYAASQIHAEDKNMVLMLGAIAVVFLTIAVPLELKQNVITIAWAVEAAILFVLGLVMKNAGMRIFALGVFLLSAIRVVTYDSSVSYEAFLQIFNKRFFTYAMVILSSACMGYLVNLKRGELEVRERGTGPFLWSAANILVLIVVTLEIFTFFDVELSRAREEIERERRKNVPVQGETSSGYIDYYQQNQYRGLGTIYNDPYANFNAKYRSLTNQRNAAISVFWALYAIILMVIGMMFRIPAVRWGALVLFGLTIFKVFIIDLASLKTYRIISFTFLG